MADLFGFEQPEKPIYTGRKRKNTQANGYAATPGSGPEGETCGSCNNFIRRGSYSGKEFFKCEIMRASWTFGVGSDIRKKSPACRRWEESK